MYLLYLFFGFIILFLFNILTNTLCLKKNIPEDKQSSVFKMINVSITILLVSSYIEVLFNV
ncbi:hypothetical protein PU629_18195 [Pullulanibacillus sp. KACC 23026]|uniref:hypothetical protein n=1 Tax=Pullulanibacillus sp. KACC 23026 TaxID=3028315 RepID=UPI0023B117E1|nr:hypothetical protein [Pullulanibacillus sp. KACC 23026]WEG12033.1 hypothetical protein PU629_18195 [Pullulanibacillus sp. KACC 23026]